jgi:hypothetical protein
VFKKLAAACPFPFRREAPARATAFNNSHSNDNRPGFRRPAARRARPKPALVCHWSKVGGRLECQWTAPSNDAPWNDAEPRPSGPLPSVGWQAQHAA